MHHADSDGQSYASLVAGESAAFARALFARLKLAIPAGIILALIAAAVLLYVWEPRYRSAACLRIIESRPFLAYRSDEGPRGFADLQVQLLRSPYIIGRALDAEQLGTQVPTLREFATREDAVNWIAQRLKVARLGNSDLYEVSFSARPPERAQRVLAAIVKSYMEYHVLDSDTHRHRMLDLLAAEQAVRDTDIELKREKLHKLARLAGGEDAAAGIGDPRHGRAGQLALIASLEQKLVETEVELTIARGRVEALRKRPVEDGLRQAEANLAITESIGEALRKKIEATRSEESRKRDRSLELEFARDELKNAEDVRRRIAERAVHLTVEGRAPSQVLLVMSATLPEAPEEPVVGTMLAPVAGAALMAPLILLLTWDLLHLRSRARASAAANSIEN